MDESRADSVVDALIEKATSYIEDTALRLSDARENLKHRDVLAALGALSGCEESVRNAGIVLGITHDYRQKLNQALDLFQGTNARAERPASSSAKPNAPRDDPGANPQEKGEK
jgi:hypothetical protein